MARKKISTFTDQRPFSPIYHDFIDSEILKSDEIALFVVLKRFADGAGNCFPSLKKLSAKTGLSKRKVQDLLKELEKKKVITKGKRTRADGGYSSNFYHLNDTAEMWQAGSVEELKGAVNEIEERRMIETLTAKGYYISKEKGLVSDTDQSTETSTYLKHFTNEKDSTKKEKSQLERYTLAQIKQLFDYNVMIAEHSERKIDIDIVFNILYDALNWTKPTIRIDGQDKPSMVVISKLMKLEQSDLWYAIEKYHEQQERIKNVNAYLLTILYHAKEQSYLDLMNLGHHNGDF